MSFSGGIIEFLPGNGNVPADPINDLLSSGMIRNEDFVSSGYQSRDELIASGYTTIGEVQDNIAASGFSKERGLKLVSSAYAMNADDGTILGDATSGVFTVTLPSVTAGSGIIYAIKRINAGANKVLVDSADGIEQSEITTLHLRRRGVSITVVSDGNMWHVI